MKTCRRCHQIKPADAYRRGRTKDGLDTYCRECQQAVRYESKDRNRPAHRAYVRANEEVKKGVYADPALYTKAVCERLAALTQRAIDRWETKTQSEASPHLTTIYEIANQIAQQQQPIERPRRTLHLVCAYCATPLTPLSHDGRKHRLYCSTICKDRAKTARKAAFQPEPPPRPPAKPKPTPTLKACEHCDTEFIGHSTKRFCSLDCQHHAYYAKNREKLIRQSLDSYYRLKAERATSDAKR